jgi:hypothetical protein
MTGTWITHVNATGTITAPSPIGTQTADIDVVQRLVVTRTGTGSSATLNYEFDICSLSTPTTTAATIQFVTTYTPALLAALTTTGSGPDTCYAVGNTVALPTFVINAGWSGPASLPSPVPSCPLIPTNSSNWVCPPAPPSTPLTCPGSGAIDSDGDGYYGVTLPTKVAGVLNICAVAGLTITTALNNMVLTNATTNTGTTNFSTAGYVFGTDSTGVGPLSVTPPANVPVTSIKLAGNVSCATILANNCTTGPTGSCHP